jgi:mono/diheme cytochrome c family protein
MRCSPLLIRQLRHLSYAVGAASLLFAVSARAQSPTGGKGAQGAASGAAALPDTAAITAEMIAKGRKIYNGKGACIVCHGMQMEGSAIAPPHKKTTGWKDAKDGAFPELVRVISSGVNGTLMVAYPNGVKPDEVVLLASYIWAVNHRGEKP